ncbi:MAG: glycerophosphodiester phosphodiesterase [Thermodesulfovibrionales bacterium]|jgi:glycerophosphoryl diester phosphodiesterase|nr:glycerophosphodiester phosphodiesterase [Thermodesulfovibrionales bacterium]
MFLKVGHRGARAYEIENTIESFKRAIELGVNAIEFDVRKTKDKKLIVIHDDNLKRVFGKEIAINQATLKELKQITEDKIPTLAEALQFIDKKVEKILIELKEIGCEKNVLKVIKKEKLHNHVIIISFYEEALSEVRRLDTKIETGLIYAKHKNPIASALKLDTQYLVPLYKLTHTKNIQDAHKNNLKVIVWTINTKQEAKVYIDKGVDGIASDKPDIL